LVPGASLTGGGTEVTTATDPPAHRRIESSATAIPVELYQRVVRVVSFLFIGSVLFIETLTGSAHTGVYGLTAIGAFGIVLFQDLLPAGALGRLRLPLEAAAAIAFLTVLLVMTGGYQSPYVFGYILLVGATSLWASGFGPAVIAVATAAAYVTAVLITSGPELLLMDATGRVAFNLVAIALVTYLASVVGGEQRRSREEALRLSRFDSMTGLHSRDYFRSAVDQEILRASRTGRPFGLVMIDLDGLKAANDRFGHASGDRLLQAVSDVLRGDLRVTDVAARYGGDEFVLMLPETDLAGALRVADKVRVDIARLALPQDGALIRTSASIGVVTFPEDGRTAVELMRRADLAMYEAKRRGRDQVVRYAREVTVPMGSQTTKGEYGQQRSPQGNQHQQPRSEPQPPQHVPPQAGSPAAVPMPAGVPVPAGMQIRPTATGPPLQRQAAQPRDVPPESPRPAPWEIRGG
jgi:diguanylate cyclase (GGDEF)-like protein